MDEQISKGTNLGVVLIALAAIIAVGFGVFALARGTANEGVTQVQETLTMVNQSQFNDYDQTIVTGNQVIGAIQNFDGKPIAILVATQAVKDNTEAHGTLDTDAAGFKGTYDESGNVKIPLVKAFESDGSTPFESPKSTGDDCKLTFINYNALLNGASMSENSDSSVKFDEGNWVATQGFSTSNGKILMNNTYKNIYKSGMVEYVSTGSRFQANLIRDASGTVLGVAFEQITAK